MTGAGAGVGREIALAYARSGAKVVVNDIGVSVHGEGGSEAPAAETVRMIEEAGGEAVADAHSVAAWDRAQAIVQTALDRFARIDVVVNNAGILRDKIFHKMTPQEWSGVIDVHLVAFDMLGSREGNLRFISVFLGKQGNPRDPLANPLFADLTGLPPIYLQVCVHDVLTHDSVRFHARAMAAGIDTTLDISPEMPHVFQFLAGKCPQADEAIAKVAAWMKLYGPCLTKKGNVQFG